jgi:hypothetical protein
VYFDRLSPSPPAQEAWSRMGISDPFHPRLSPPNPGYDNFPDGGINNHQSTQQWADASVQAEASTSLALAKPDYIENNVRSEVSELFLPRRRSCSTITALATVKHSGWLELRGRLRPRPERTGQIQTPCRDPRGARNCSYRGCARDPSER